MGEEIALEDKLLEVYYSLSDIYHRLIKFQ